MGFRAPGGPGQDRPDQEGGEGPEDVAPSRPSRQRGAHRPGLGQDEPAAPEGGNDRSDQPTGQPLRGGRRTRRGVSGHEATEAHVHVPLAGDRREAPLPFDGRPDEAQVVQGPVAQARGRGFLGITEGAQRVYGGGHGVEDGAGLPCGQALCATKLKGHPHLAPAPHPRIPPRVTDPPLPHCPGRLRLPRPSRAPPPGRNGMNTPSLKAAIALPSPGRLVHPPGPTRGGPPPPLAHARLRGRRRAPTSSAPPSRPSP